MPMTGDMILESLDSLWFFSNVLSHPSSPPKSTALNPIQPPPKLVESPNTLVINPEETSTEQEQKIPQPESFRVSPRSRKDHKMEQRRKKSNREQGRKRTHKFHEEEMICLVSTLLKQHRCCYYQSCAGVAAVGEDLAMKEHLKSWAHAVACSVK